MGDLGQEPGGGPDADSRRAGQDRPKRVSKHQLLNFGGDLVAARARPLSAEPSEAYLRRLTNRNYRLALEKGRRQTISVCHRPPLPVGYACSLNQQARKMRDYLCALRRVHSLKLDVVEHHAHLERRHRRRLLSCWNTPWRLAHCVSPGQWWNHQASLLASARSKISRCRSHSTATVTLGPSSSMAQDTARSSMHAATTLTTPGPASTCTTRPPLRFSRSRTLTRRLCSACQR